MTRAVAPDTGAELLQDQRLRAFLVVDCGRSTVKASLFDTVEGRIRLVAQAAATSTGGQPWFDVRVGVRQALAQINATTGRSLLDAGGNIIRPARADGTGVDWFGILLSGAEALEAVAVGLLEETSLASVRRALQTTYAREVDGYSPLDRRGPWRRVSDLVAAGPDVIVLGGGSDGGAERRLVGLVEEVALACEVMDVRERPRVIFAGNSHVQEQVQLRLGDLTDLRVVANVRPAHGVEYLHEAEEALGEIYVEAKGATLPGFVDLRQLSDATPQPTAQAFGTICRVMAAQLDGVVLGLDFGAGSLTVVDSWANGSSVQVLTELGLGHPLASRDRSARGDQWYGPISLEQEAGPLSDLSFEKRVHPQAAPLQMDDLTRELELVRAMVQAVGRATAADIGPNPLKRLVLRGQVLGAEQGDGRVVRAVLDGLRPHGLFQVLVDRWQVLAALGLLAQHLPALTAQVLASEIVQPLFWVVGARLRDVRAGDVALRVHLRGSDGYEFDREVEAGELAVLNIPAGRRLELTVKPLRRTDVGAGSGVEVKTTIAGKALALLVDARGPGAPARTGR